MKHLLTLALCTAALALAPTPSHAGAFGLFYWGRCCKKCSFCVKPYNAFTPVVCGTADLGLQSQGHSPFFQQGRLGWRKQGLYASPMMPYGYPSPYGYPMPYGDDGMGNGAFGPACGSVPFIGTPVMGRKCCSLSPETGYPVFAGQPMMQAPMQPVSYQPNDAMPPMYPAYGYYPTWMMPTTGYPMGY